MTQVVSSLVQVAFFITPIFWEIGQAQGWRSLFVTFNPLFHYVDILRSPLLGKLPSVESWLIVIALTFIGWGVTLSLFNRYKTRIIFWI